MAKPVATIIQFPARGCRHQASEPEPPAATDIQDKIASRPRFITEQDWRAILLLSLWIKSMHSESTRAMECLQKIEQSIGVKL